MAEKSPYPYLLNTCICIFTPPVLVYYETGTYVQQHHQHQHVCAKHCSWLWNKIVRVAIMSVPVCVRHMLWFTVNLDECSKCQYLYICAIYNCLLWNQTVMCGNTVSICMCTPHALVHSTWHTQCMYRSTCKQVSMQWLLGHYVQNNP